MGERGPAPRREAEVRRTNNKGTAEQIPREKLQNLPFEVDVDPQPPALPAGSTWHPMIQQFWEAMQRDPGRKWMTSGDWAATMVICETMSRELNEQVIGTTKDGEIIMGTVPPKSATVMAFLKTLSQIGVTEDARLRLRKEVTLFPAPAPVASVTNVAEIKDRRRDSVQ